MGKQISLIARCLSVVLFASQVTAAPATSVLGKDYIFPNELEGLPDKGSHLSSYSVGLPAVRNTSM
jgi:hypothetical protein